MNHDTWRRFSDDAEARAQHYRKIEAERDNLLAENKRLRAARPAPDALKGLRGWLYKERNEAITSDRGERALAMVSVLAKLDSLTTPASTLEPTEPKSCEMCDHCCSYNEDRQLWCIKRKRQVSEADADNCADYSAFDGSDTAAEAGEPTEREPCPYPDRVCGECELGPDQPFGDLTCGYGAPTPATEPTEQGEGENDHV